MTSVLRHIPNLITIMRMLLVIPVVFSLRDGQYTLALILFFVAGTSDALDGYLARAFGWYSRFGAITDPLADKLLLVSCYATLTWTGVVPVWLLMVVLGRDLYILGGALLYHNLAGPFQITPTLSGKLSTFVQITYVLVVIANLAGLAMPSWVVANGAWIVTIMAIWSAVEYTLEGLRRYRRVRSRLPAHTEKQGSNSTTSPEEEDGHP